MSTINFTKYDEENPHIWQEFLKIARQAKVKGFTRYSAKGIFEIIRWETGVTGNDAFKVNNNYTPDYARKAATLFPEEFADFFRVREVRAPRA